MNRDRLCRACKRMTGDPEVFEYLFNELADDIKNVWASTRMNEANERDLCYYALNGLEELKQKIENLAGELDDAT